MLQVRGATFPRFKVAELRRKLGSRSRGRPEPGASFWEEQLAKFLSRPGALSKLVLGGWQNTLGLRAC